MSKRALALDGVCLLSGMLLVLAFAPFNQNYLVLIAPALLLACWLNATPKRALWRGFLFGLGLFGVGASWVYVSIATYGGTSVLAASAITALFIVIMACYPALTGWVWRRFFRNNTAGVLCAFPALWVVFEWLRGHLIFGGFPWLNLGDAQSMGPLSGYLPILGSYGVSLLAAFCAALLVCLYRLRHTKAWTACFFGLLLLGAVGIGLSKIQWTHALGQSTRVALVQGNIAQSLKWNPRKNADTVQRYWQLSQPYSKYHLLFWPETAIPFYPQQIDPYLHDLNLALQKDHSALLTGIPLYENKHAYNGAMVLGNGHGQYLKRDLVPFGEYIPMQQFFGRFFAWLSIPMSQFHAGPAHQPLPVLRGIPIEVLICYESAYGDGVRHHLQNGQLIAVLSDDGWFGRSLGLYQHAQLSQIRALETGRYVINATNNGITEIIDTQGKIVKHLAPFKAGVLSGSVQRFTGYTPWVWWGICPTVLLVLVLLGIALFYKKYAPDK